jgi:hypothetical protein
MKLSVVLVLLLILLPAGCSHEPKMQESKPEKIRAKWEAEVQKVIKDPVRVEKIVGLGVEYELKQHAIRHLYYDLKDDKLLQNMSFSGPALGVTFCF